MKVKNEMTVYELDGVWVFGIPEETVVIRSHDSDSDLVVLEFFRKSERVVAATVSAHNLRRAIANATNWK